MRDKGLTFLAATAVALFAVAIARATTHGKHHSSRVFEGVAAKFQLLNPSVRADESLRIRIRLINTSNRAITFGYSAGPFVQHVHIYDAANNEMPRRIDAPIPEPIAATAELAPHGKYETEVSVDLGTYYELTPGKYRLRFYYDLRLLDDPQTLARYRQLYHSSDFVLWDSQYYSFDVER